MSQATNDAVRKYYERFGTRIGYNLLLHRSQHFGYYDARHTSEKAAQQRHLEKLLALLDIGDGMSILDAGCGQGVVAVAVAATANVHVDGITLVPREVAAAQKLASKRKVQDRTDFKVKDYATLGKQQYDRIYTVETLSHASDVQAVIDGFWQALKPGGKLVCIEYEFDYANHPTELLRQIDFATEHGGMHGLRQFSQGQFRQSLAKAGYTDITESDWTNAGLPSFRRIRRIAQPVRAVTKRLGKDRHFINTTVANYYADAAERGVFWYKAYTATKPM